MDGWVKGCGLGGRTDRKDHSAALREAPGLGTSGAEEVGKCGDGNSDGRLGRGSLQVSRGQEGVNRGRETVSRVVCTEDGY